MYYRVMCTMMSHTRVYKDGLLKKFSLVTMAHRCSYCDKAYTYLGNLQLHLKTEHGGLRFRCDVCIRSYRSKEAKRNHMEEEHDIKGYHMVPEFKCYACGKQYVRKKQLHNHIIAEHLEVDFPCGLCDKVFKYNHFLKRHYNRKHKEHKFDYEKLLKEGRDHWRESLEKNSPIPKDKENAVIHYLWYLNTQSVTL